MSKPQKLLLGWTVALLAAAESIKHLHLSDRTQMIAGAAEVVLAMATGIAFGISRWHRQN